MNHRYYLIEHPRFGKIIGAILGFMMAGTFGAFFGIFIGNFFDQGLAQHLAKPHAPFRAERNQAVKAIFLQATFSMLGAIAKANGRVTEDSIRIAQRIMSELNLNKAQRERAQRDFNQGKKNNFNLTPLAIQLKQATGHNPLLLKLFITIQYEHAEEIGLSNANITLFNHMLQSLGFAAFHEQARANPFTQSYSQSHTYSRSRHTSPPPASDSLMQAYQLLSVSPDASQTEVKRAYRRLISLHHPDKIISQQANASKIKTANEKTQSITKAYEQICKSRGW